MKSKITFKLIGYFSIALLLFAVIIGGVFLTLFQNYTMEIHRSQIEDRATTMASTLSDLMEGPSFGMGMMGRRQAGLGMYYQFLDDIAMTDVWIVDENLELITVGHMGNQQYYYHDLPPDAEEVVENVFRGETTFSEGFSDLLDTPTLTVGTPIVVGDRVLGALLLHSPVEGMSTAIDQGMQILIISIGVALAVAIILSIILALNFVKPLKKMKNTALQLADGNYNAKTGVQQEDEIGELASTMDTLGQRLEIASREREKLFKLRQEFVANISHELRTPVTVIRGSLEALHDGVVTEPGQIQNYYEQMLKESVFLQRLVNDLLDLSRLQNTDFKIQREKINLCDVLNDVVRSGEQIGKDKDIVIQKNINTRMCVIIGDYGRLRQMFLIVLENAIKFSNKGNKVIISFQDNIVSIRDQGIGIPQEDIPYIFDRYHKKDTEENKKGTGLGLAIAKQIAQRHDIGIEVSSKEGEGAEFRFLIKQ